MEVSDVSARVTVCQLGMITDVVGVSIHPTVVSRECQIDTLV